MLPGPIHPPHLCPSWTAVTVAGKEESLDFKTEVLA